MPPLCFAGSVWVLEAQTASVPTYVLVAPLVLRVTIGSCLRQINFD